MGDVGTHPPLIVEVAVSATNLKTIVEFPVFFTVTLTEFGLRLVDMISKCVTSWI